MASHGSFTIILLPKQIANEEQWNKLVELAREFRLTSLKLAGGLFGRSYEQEVDMPLEFWTNRVANPKATTFVAVRRETSDTNDTQSNDSKLIFESEWLGWIVPLGPQDGFAEFPGSTSPWEMLSRDNTVSPRNDAMPTSIRQFLITGMFVLPNTRGTGVGRALVNTALDNALRETKASGAKEMMCTLIVDKDNDPARTLYERCGFQGVREKWFKPEIGEERIALTMRLSRSVDAV
ncbi:MAG: hypothetical protein M1820_000587 [Bogoriella megaspora]|nr:MAG: hypothetical protein M1820_000587 [Bogoriella megaspora]